MPRIEHTKNIAGALAEIIWELGAQGLDGECCAGLSLVEHRALGHLAKGHDCDVQTVGQGAGLSRSGATRLVNRLEERGLLVKERSSEDARVCCVGLTAEGRRSLSKAERVFVARLERILAGLPQEMRAKVTEVLPVLAGAVRREANKCC